MGDKDIVLIRRVQELFFYSFSNFGLGGKVDLLILHPSSEFTPYGSTCLCDIGSLDCREEMGSFSKRERERPQLQMPCSLSQACMCLLVFSPEESPSRVERNQQCPPLGLSPMAQESRRKMALWVLAHLQFF